MNQHRKRALLVACLVMTLLLLVAVVTGHKWLGYTALGFAVLCALLAESD